MSGRRLPEGACRTSAFHGPAVKGGRCAACYLASNPDPAAPRRATRRAVVGCTITGFDQHPERVYDGRGGGVTLHRPELRLGDGSRLTFEVEVGPGGLHGVRVVRTPPTPDRPRRRA